MNKNRLLNISWTISSDYSYDFENIFKSDSRYISAILGFSHKYFNLNRISEFFEKFYIKLNNYKELLTVMRITLENAIFEKILEERPGVISFRDEYISDFFDSLNSKEIILKYEIESTFYDLKRGRIPISSNITFNMVKEIINFKTLDTKKYLEFIEYIFEKYFHINKDIPLDTNHKIKTFIEKSNPNNLNKNLKETTSNKNILDLDMDLEMYNIGSAEFTELPNFEEKRVVEEEFKAKSSSEKDIYEATKKHFGKEKFPQWIKNKIEKEISTGIHKDIKLFFANGDFENSDSYYAKKEEESFLDNKAFYNKNYLIYERSIRKLSQIVKNTLLQDNEDESIISDTGSIIAKDLWKIEHLNDQKVFRKFRKEESKDIYVDILLDSSLSQDRRKNIIATESYIIASALTRLNIKTRVISFSNFYNYIVFHKFRDYTDPISKNIDIFKYHPTGSNRDGLAIKYMRYISPQVDSEKFLIVLSDGKPNDEINLGLVGKQKLSAKDYIDKDAIMDTSREILLTKLKNINTFGVFTGEYEDIYTIKKIYGNDFAYITDLKRFHDVVGIFLKTFAQKIK